MTATPASTALDASEIERHVQAAVRMIPPVWPLASSVAVNPFLGQTALTLAETGARLGRVGGLRVTMEHSWFRERIAKGLITDQDLDAALAKTSSPHKPAHLAALKAMLEQNEPKPQALATIADLAADASGTDWPALINERFGVWAAGYFDQGQALWAAPRGKSAWAAWRAWATHDLTPEIHGLKRFATYANDLADTPYEAIRIATQRLGLSLEALETYFHQLLLSLGGWAHYARYELWKAELAQSSDTTLIELLAIRLAWEDALHAQYAPLISDAWAKVREAHAQPLEPTPDHILASILQEAAERAAQRDLAATLTAPGKAQGEARPILQAAFCIDVRSEVFRRALESVDPSIRTLGFAGFFGVFAKHRRFASDVEELRLPVLLNPTVSSRAGGYDPAAPSKDLAAKDLATRYTARAKRAWGRFKLAAVSSFAFVESMGPVYVAKLVRDALNLRAMPLPNDPAPRLIPPLDLSTRIGAAETVLRAMSLTKDFARIVLLAGHGANVINNPHASALHCGACGGYSGEVNSRLLSTLLNEADVRQGLVARGITIPEDTLFIAALHDTTTDTVLLYDQDNPSADHKADLAKVRAWLETAGVLTRGERALRLPGAHKQQHVPRRARNWAEVRPEWALAGCKAFIAAPRARTTGRDLEGRAFLHDYDWHQDSAKGFGVLELIMTAPVVVASWISLQYYGSTVAPEAFGSGNKLLHNVVGGIGVFEGNAGPLRAGLAWQSVHDGDTLIHEPLRLSVCIEAPIEAMTDILKRHDNVRALFDNTWLHLFALNDHGHIAARYVGNLTWEAIETAAPVRTMEAAA